MICSVLCFIAGFVCGGVVLYIITRRKQAHGLQNKPDESGSTISESQDSKPPPVYEIIGTSTPSQEAIELQGNLAYGPLKKHH